MRDMQSKVLDKVEQLTKDAKLEAVRTTGNGSNLVRVFAQDGQFQTLAQLSFDFQAGGMTVVLTGPSVKGTDYAGQKNSARFHGEYHDGKFMNRVFDAYTAAMTDAMTM